MTTLLTVLTIALSLLYLGAGIFKSVTPREKLLVNMGWANYFSAWQIKAIGLAEALFAAGLLINLITDLNQLITVFCASGLAIMMLICAVIHIYRQEYGSTIMAGLLCVTALVVSWGAL